MENLPPKDTILIVDDEQVVLDVSTLMVKKLGHKVLQAKTGLEAFQIFRNNKDAICLVILDMKLPDEKGSDVCRKLKEINSEVKILHTSGFGSGLGDEILECGCDNCLPKPFKFEDLSNKLKDLLENKRR